MTNTNLKTKAAKMRSERILRALSAIHDGTMTLLSDDTIVNGGGKRYTLNAEGRCSCADSTGFVAKFNAQLEEAGITPALQCKHDFARVFAAGHTIRIGRVAYRLKDAVLQSAVQPVESAAPVAKPETIKGTPEYNALWN